MRIRKPPQKKYNVYESKNQEQKHFFLTKPIDMTKTIFSSLKVVFGLGMRTIHQICNQFGFSPNVRLIEIPAKIRREIIKYIRKLKKPIGSVLERNKNMVKSKIKKLKHYRQLRMRYRLPSRGQRTHSNSKTARKGFF